MRYCGLKLTRPAEIAVVRFVVHWRHHIWHHIHIVHWWHKLSCFWVKPSIVRIVTNAHSCILSIRAACTCICNRIVNNMVIISAIALVHLCVKSLRLNCTVLADSVWLFTLLFVFFFLIDYKFVDLSTD